MECLSKASLHGQDHFGEIGRGMLSSPACHNARHITITNRPRRPTIFHARLKGLRLGVEYAALKFGGQQIKAIRHV